MYKPVKTIYIRRTPPTRQMYVEVGIAANYFPLNSRASTTATEGGPMVLTEPQKKWPNRAVRRLEHEDGLNSRAISIRPAVADIASLWAVG